jgi:hypothetical protein
MDDKDRCTTERMTEKVQLYLLKCGNLAMAE